jgi:hypothetical protein
LALTAAAFSAHPETETKVIEAINATINVLIHAAFLDCFRECPVQMPGDGTMDNSTQID